MPTKEFVYFAGGNVLRLNITIFGKPKLGLLDTGATCSIASVKAIPKGCQIFHGAPCTVKMGNGQVEPLTKLVRAQVPVANKKVSHQFYVLETDAFDFVVGTDFFVAHPECTFIGVQQPFEWSWRQPDGKTLSFPLKTVNKVPSCLVFLKTVPDKIVSEKIVSESLESLEDCFVIKIVQDHLEDFQLETAIKIKVFDQLEVGVHPCKGDHVELFASVENADAKLFFS